MDESSETPKLVRSTLTWCHWPSRSKFASLEGKAPGRSRPKETDESSPLDPLNQIASGSLEELRAQKLKVLPEFGWIKGPPPARVGRPRPPVRADPRSE